MSPKESYESEKMIVQRQELLFQPLPFNRIVPMIEFDDAFLQLCVTIWPVLILIKSIAFDLS